MRDRNPTIGHKGGLESKAAPKGSRKAGEGRSRGESGSLRRGDGHVKGAIGMRNLYHYVESGLDTVFLANGFEQRNGTVTIHDLDGLHKAIGSSLACKRQRLTGKEFRFLRTELLLSQSSLAQVLGVRELTVARWEKGENDIPVTTEAALRTMYAESIGREGRMRDLLERIADLDNEIDQTITLSKSKREWQEIAAA